MCNYPCRLTIPVCEITGRMSPRQAVTWASTSPYTCWSPRVVQIQQLLHRAATKLCALFLSSFFLTWSAPFWRLFPFLPSAPAPTRQIRTTLRQASWPPMHSGFLVYQIFLLDELFFLTFLTWTPYLKRTRNPGLKERKWVCNAYCLLFSTDSRRLHSLFYSVYACIDIVHRTRYKIAILCAHAI